MISTSKNPPHSFTCSTLQVQPQRAHCLLGWRSLNAQWKNWIDRGLNVRKLNWQKLNWQKIELINGEARLVLSWHRYIDTTIEQGTTHTRSTEIFTQRQWTLCRRFDVAPQNPIAHQKPPIDQTRRLPSAYQWKQSSNFHQSRFKPFFISNHFHARGCALGQLWEIRTPRTAPWHRMEKRISGGEHSHHSAKSATKRRTFRAKSLPKKSQGQQLYRCQLGADIEELRRIARTYACGGNPIEWNFWNAGRQTIHETRKNAYPLPLSGIKNRQNLLGPRADAV